VSRRQDNTAAKMVAWHFEQLCDSVAPLREDLIHHPIYAEVNSLNRLRAFMKSHVFAVWDFMSLLKRLQAELTCQSLPWIPSPSAEITRFANEMTLAEETDLDRNSEPASHFELYLRAMDEVGADSASIRMFVDLLKQGLHWSTALTDAKVPSGVSDFVSHTLNTAIHGSVVEVASCFYFGREDVIPEMFKRLLRLWNNHATEVPNFAYYLERHIHLDGDNHGPWARQMLISLIGDDERHWNDARCAAQRAILSRIKLWDELQRLLGKW
jgi:Protein of unknown function (DUF3050)